VFVLEIGLPEPLCRGDIILLLLLVVDEVSLLITREEVGGGVNDVELESGGGERESGGPLGGREGKD
jgi:hypothetical protein